MKVLIIKKTIQALLIVFIDDIDFTVGYTNITDNMK